jgi:hypothetical protein
MIEKLTTKESSGLYNVCRIQWSLLHRCKGLASIGSMKLTNLEHSIPLINMHSYTVYPFERLLYRFNLKTGEG